MIRKFSVEPKDVGDLIQLLVEMRYRFLEQYGREPSGFILGPTEYLCLRLGMDTKFHALDRRMGAVDKVLGLPIHIKRTPGIDLAIPHEMAFLFAHTTTEGRP